MSEKNSMAHATTRYARYFEIVTQPQVLYWCRVGDCSCQHFLQNGQAGHQHLAHSLQFWHRLRSWKFPSGSVAGPVLRYLPIWKSLLHLATLCFAKFKRVNHGTLGQALICEIVLNSGRALGSLTLGRSKPNKHYSLYRGVPNNFFQLFDCGEELVRFRLSVTGLTENLAEANKVLCHEFFLLTIKLWSNIGLMMPCAYQT